MTLLRALALPFQPTSLLFVGFTAALLALVGSVGGPIDPLTILPTYFLLSWINKYAFALLDQAANGSTDAPVASVEMLGPAGDWRAIVHPLLAALVAIVAWWLHGYARAFVTLATLSLFPASIGALAISHRFVDAINPLALWRTARDLGTQYLALLALMLFIAIAVVLLLRLDVTRLVLYVAAELLVLALYAAIGGALRDRRIDLGFEPLHSPERRAQREADEHVRTRQAVLDAVYASTHAGNYVDGSVRLREWLESAHAQLEPDADATVRQALAWQKDRAVAETVRTVVSHCIRVRQPAVAVSAVESVLRRIPAFAPASEAEALAMAKYARETGRRDLARRLLDNFTAAHPEAPPSPEAASLRTSLGD